MQFKQCAVCNLSLPINIMQPIQIRHNGKIVVVGICNRCKVKKEEEAKRRQNEPIN
jgi:C4-type Zn-finger protein